MSIPFFGKLFTFMSAATFEPGGGARAAQTRTVVRKDVEQVTMDRRSRARRAHVPHDAVYARVGSVAAGLGDQHRGCRYAGLVAAPSGVRRQQPSRRPRYRSIPEASSTAR
jgi:hypothetical protein